MIEDVYSGSTQYGSSNNHQTLNVLGTASTTLTAGTSVNPGTVGKSLNLTAAVAGTSGTPTGSVSFLVNGTAAACSTGSPKQPLGASGTATCKWTPSAAGTYTVSFTYSGDRTYAAAARRRTPRSP